MFLASSWKQWGKIWCQEKESLISRYLYRFSIVTLISRDYALQWVLVLTSLKKQFQKWIQSKGYINVYPLVLAIALFF